MSGKQTESKLKNAKPGSVSAVAACPEVLEWLDPDKNKGIDIESITAGSKVKMHFRCPKCGEPMYREMQRFLTKQKDGTYRVPVCQKCKPTVRKDRVWLNEAVPDIEKYWNYELNKGRKPSEFSAVAPDKVWTNCPLCGTPVRRNVRFTWAADENGVGHVIHCRTCGKKTDKNSLVAAFPEIRKYWNYQKNEHDPEYYTVASGKKVYIACPECGGKRYLAICDAVDSKTGTYRLSLCNSCAQRKSGNLNAWNEGKRR